MASRPVPTAPAGLSAPGKALWKALHGALPDQAEFDEREHSILAAACRQADDLDKLERAVKRDGVTVEGSMGQPRLHPAVSELRQGRIALARLLGELEIPDFEEQAVSSASKRARHAASVRWAQAAARKAVRDGA